MKLFHFLSRWFKESFDIKENWRRMGTGIWVRDFISGHTANVNIRMIQIKTIYQDEQNCDDGNHSEKNSSICERVPSNCSGVTTFLVEGSVNLAG